MADKYISTHTGEQIDDAVDLTNNVTKGNNNLHNRITSLETFASTTQPAIDAAQNNRLTALESGKVNVSDIKDNLTSSDTDEPLSANQGKVLKGMVDGIEGVTIQVGLPSENDPNYNYSKGRYVKYSATSNSYLQTGISGLKARNTWFVPIPAGYDTIRARTKATTILKAIAFFTTADYSTAEFISGVDGASQSLREYVATVPSGATAFIVSSYNADENHTGFAVTIEKSNTLSGLGNRVEALEDDVEEMAGQIEDIEESIAQLPDHTAALNPKTLPLTETGSYYRDGEENPYTTEKGAHSQLFDIRGYTRCRYYGNISGKILVFFDENQERIASLDVAGAADVTGTVDLTEKIDGGAVYMVFNCYNNYSNFRSYWCKIDVPTTMLERIETIESAVDTIDNRLDALENSSIPASYEVPLKVSNQYVSYQGETITTSNEKYKTTGNVSIPASYDRVRVTSHSLSTMSAIMFSDGTKHIVSSDLSQTTRTFDVAVPDGVTSFIASTDFATTFRCIMYDSARWEDDYINVLVLGDSITDTVTSDSREGIVIDGNNKSTEYHERSASKWPSLLKDWKPIRELRNYAKQGAHWCDFSTATFRQKMSQQVTIAVADKTNSALFGTETFNPDVIIIAMGTNDASGVYDVGSTIGDALETMQKESNELDMTIVTDAIRKNVETLKSTWPDAVIYMSMPIQRATSTFNTLLLIRTQMLTICKDVVQQGNDDQGVPEVLGLGCKVIDSTYESGITQANLDAVTKDGLHPNVYGQCMLAECIIKGIKRHNIMK